MEGEFLLVKIKICRSCGRVNESNNLYFCTADCARKEWFDLVREKKRLLSDIKFIDKELEKRHPRKVKNEQS